MTGQEKKKTTKSRNQSSATYASMVNEGGLHDKKNAIRRVARHVLKTLKKVERGSRHDVKAEEVLRERAGHSAVERLAENGMAAFKK